MPTPPANALSSTFQAGTYTSLTDTFTSVFDLNDGVTTTIMWNTLKMPQPEKVFVRSFNLRAPGERVTRFQYKNRHIQVSVSLRGATVQAILNTCHSLIAAIENPTYRLRIAQPNATQYTYATVVAVTHNIPADPQTLLAKALTNVQIDFECLPGLLGDRVTLQNLVVNPGFEAPSGPGVVAFIDNFSNVNAYTVAAGSVPTVAAGVMTIPAGTRLQFGSPAWGAINSWQMRVQTPAAGGWDFQPALHINGTSSIFGNFFSTGIELHQNSNGTDHLLGSTAFGALATSTWYWLTLTQFPVQAGNAAYVQLSVNADSAGAIGALIATLGPVVTFDAVSALTGRMQLNAVTGAWNVSSNVAQIFGPGGWTTVQNGGTGLVSFAWEHALEFSATTYPNGPAVSNGAARIDFAPAGTISAYWTNFNSGTPTGSNAIPASPSQTFGVSAQAKTSGVGVGFQAILYLSEYNSSGSFLRQTQIQALTGVQPWMTLSGTATTGANCAFVSVWLLAFDNSAGSVNGTIWFDNVQCWNQTTTGQTTMPYCELRFQQSPAQLMVSGLVGDLPTPATVAVGTYLASWALGSTITMLLGRRALTHAQLQLIRYPLQPYATPGGLFLDSNSYGGYFIKSATAQASAGGNLVYVWPNPAAGIGTYHLFERAQTSQTAGNLGNVKSQLAAFDGVAVGVGNQANFFNAFVANQFSASVTWALIDHGAVFVPLFGQGALSDPSQQYESAYGFWQDSTAGGSQWSFGVPWLLPIDADVLGATLINPNNAGGALTTFWLWAYSDAISQATGSSFAWGFSGETTALPQVAHSIGGPGTLNSGQPSINFNATPYLTLDPQAGNGTAAAAVNQMVGSITDQTNTLLPLYCEIQYIPLYLYPR